MNCPITQLSGPNYEAVARFFPVDASVRIAIDVMEYCTRHMPLWNILNINAYNMREMTIDAIQEGAWTLSLAADYIRRMLDRGLDIDSFAGRIAVFANVQMSFLEEIAKLRAMRRAWAEMMRERFGAKNPRSCWLRLAVQTGALALTAQQPMNNMVRTTIQTLAAVLAGVQSIHTTAYDEAYALPTEESHKLAVRTQQIIAYETDVAKTVDPLGGSYAIESLTAELKKEMESLAQDIERRGGFIECFKSRWIEEQINKARYEYMRQLESRERPIIGVNLWEEEEESKIVIFRQRPEMQEERKEYIKAYKKNRDQEKLSRVLETLYHKAKEKVNIFPFVLDAVRARATLQEVIDTLRKAEDFEIRI
jgi:methylmalonyl-CoA mutase N-terminal domain/subunit